MPVNNFGIAGVYDAKDFGVPAKAGSSGVLAKARYLMETPK